MLLPRGIICYSSQNLKYRFEKHPLSFFFFSFTLRCLLQVSEFQAWERAGNNTDGKESEGEANGT